MAELRTYTILNKADYDKSISVGSQKLRCYSKNQLDKMYTNGARYRVVGGITNKKKLAQVAAASNGTGEALKVARVSDFNKLLYGASGFLCVGEDTYLAVMSLNMPFIILSTVLATAVVAGGVTTGVVLSKDKPTPINPLPPTDSNVISDPITTPASGIDPVVKDPVAEGSTSVSMIYQLDAKLSLSSKEVSIYFKNPTASTADVLLELYLVSGEQEYLIASSGRVQPGFALYKLDADVSKIALTAGNTYGAKYKVAYYDAVTGERALVESEITDVVVTVEN